MDADQIPAELVEKAAYAIFAQEQCDKRQARDVPYQWNTRLDEADHEEYRDLARHALAAVYREVQARALQEARHAVRAMTPAPNSRLTWESAQSKAARTLLEMEKALRTPKETP